MADGSDRQIGVIAEALFFEYQMVGRKYCHDRFRCAFVNVHQGQKYPWTAFSVCWLDDDIFVCLIGKLSAHLSEAQMLFANDGDNLPLRNQKLGAMDGMLKHRALADKVNVLFGQFDAAA